MSWVRVGVVPKAIDNSAFELARIGAEEAATELTRTSLIFAGPVRPTAAGQIKIIEDLLGRRVDVLAVNANDPQKLTDCLVAAEREGTSVLTWDAGVLPKSRFLHLCPAGDDVLARAWLRSLREAMPAGGGRFAVLSTTERAPNQNRWLTAIKAELATPAYADIHLCDIAYGEDDANQSRAEIKALIETHADLAAVLSLTGVGSVAAAEVIEGLGLSGRVFVTGLGYPSELAPFVTRGTVKSFAVWSMIDLGYAAVRIAHGLANEQQSWKVGSAIDIGRLGQRRIEPDFEISLTEPRIYDAGNVNAAARNF